MTPSSRQMGAGIPVPRSTSQRKVHTFVLITSILCIIVAIVLFFQWHETKEQFRSVFLASNGENNMDVVSSQGNPSVVMGDDGISVVGSQQEDKTKSVEMDAKGQSTASVSPEEEEDSTYSNPTKLPSSDNTKTTIPATLETLQDYQTYTIQNIRSNVMNSSLFSTFMKEAMGFELSRKELELYRRGSISQSVAESLEESIQSSENVPYEEQKLVLQRLQDLRHSLFSKPDKDATPLPVSDLDDYEDYEEEEEDEDDEVELAPGVRLSVFDGHDLSLHRWVRWRSTLFGGDQDSTSLQQQSTTDHASTPQAQPSVVLFHIDSHPDMAPPKQFDVSKFEASHLDQEWLIENVQIANFIAPVLYMGWISKVVWVASPFSHQIPRGEHNITLGVYPGDGLRNPPRLGVNSSLHYFNSHMQKQSLMLNRDGSPKKLLNPKTVTLQVIEAEEFLQQLNKEKETAAAEQIMDNLLQTSPHSEATPTKFLLDIDLDYWATISPTFTFAKEHNTSRIRNLLSRIVDPSTYCSLNETAYPLDNMAKVATSAWTDVVHFCLFYQDQQDSSLRHFLKKTEALTKSYWCKGKQDAQDFMIELYELLDGMEATSRGRCNQLLLAELPFYLPSDEEINESAQTLANLFLRISEHHKMRNPGSSTGGFPSMVTVARSVWDDYTPFKYWEKLERVVYELLRTIWRSDGSAAAASQKPVLSLQDILQK